MAYRKCDTRIVDLKSLALPEGGTDNEYRQIYQQYVENTSGTTKQNANNLRDAIESIKYGIAPPVAFPTETVYGLGADATNEPAVTEIFAAKARPSDNPLIVHVSSKEHLQKVIDQPVPEIYQAVIEMFWPGPLTILLPVSKGSRFAKNVFPGQCTIGFRMPSSKYARFFIAAADRPIAGPSANSSGKPSPTTAHHVLDDLNGKINFILDGGPCQVGVESTVVDGIHDPPLILRPGGVSREELVALGGKWANTEIGYSIHSHSTSSSGNDDQKDHRKQNGVLAHVNGAPRAPGMKYRHYSPIAKLILFTLEAREHGRVREMLDSLPKPLGKTGKIRVGFLDHTWGEYAGLMTDRKGHQDVLAYENAIDGIDFQQWDRYSREGTYVETKTHTIFSLRVASQSANKGTINELARELFSMLRFFDAIDCDYIFAETVERTESVNIDERVVDAVADRLNKAASETISE